jgi:23S rRNA pseudouridine1911/1915/1917 synthase
VAGQDGSALQAAALMAHKRTAMVSEEDAGLRADVFVAKLYPDFARSTLAKLFDDHITLNGETVKHGYKLRTGDTVLIDEDPLRRQPPSIDLPILYEDDDVIVIDKPSGVLTHSKGGLNNEATIASFIKGRLSGFENDNNRAGIVHRLDRATSGVMVTAKNPSAQAYLQKQFSARKVKKTYLALIEGVLTPPEAIIDAAIERNPVRPQTFKVSSLGRPAQTHYRMMKTKDELSLVELRPATGRTHQLRVHLKYTHHPIVGDFIYGGKDARRLMLHASKLEITIPGGLRRVYSSPPPKEFTELRLK